MIALVVPIRADQNVPVVMEFVTAVVNRARAFDHDVLLLTQDEGVVLRQLHQPAVLIGVPERPSRLSCVDLDFAAAGSLAVEHLVELGHRAVGLVGQPAAVFKRHTSYALRLLVGLRDTAAAAGVDVAISACESSFDGLQACLDALLGEQPDTTALIVHNEAVLPALATALRQRGRGVPDRMSVVAICPDMAGTHEVAFTNIAIPTEELGSIAVDMAMRQLDAPTAAETRLLTPVLTVRASTTKPRSRR